MCVLVGGRDLLMGEEKAVLCKSSINNGRRWNKAVEVVRVSE